MNRRINLVIFLTLASFTFGIEYLKVVEGQATTQPYEKVLDIQQWPADSDSYTVKVGDGFDFNTLKSFKVQFDTGADEFVMLFQPRQSRGFRLARGGLQDFVLGLRHGAALLVNTTSQGMAGEAALDLQLDHLPPQALVSDIVYVPLETPLLAAARGRGNPVVDGLGMLLHQARPGFAAWFGVAPEVTPGLRDAVLRTFVEP